MTTSAKDLSPTLRAHLSGKNEGRVLGMMDAFAWCMYMALLRAGEGHDGPGSALLLLANTIDDEAARRHPAEWAAEKKRRLL